MYIMECLQNQKRRRLYDDDHLQQLSVTPIHNFSRYLRYGQADRHALKGTNIPISILFAKVINHVGL